MEKIKNKRAQGEVITTVLLILIGIAAVVLVSTFVISMVRNNLKGTDCFKTAGQLEIDNTAGRTFFNSSNNGTLQIMVKRGQKDFNLTGLSVGFGNQNSVQTIQLISGKPSSNLFNVNTDGSQGSNNLTMPKPGETRGYIMTEVTTSYQFSSINVVSISPILNDGSSCEKSDEKNL